MRSSSPPADGGWATIAGLALLLFGCVLGVFPLLPLTPAGEGGMNHVPHAPLAAVLLVLAGAGLLLWRRGGSAPRPR